MQKFFKDVIYLIKTRAGWIILRADKLKLSALHFFHAAVV
jgi:hypothetical protein